MVDRYRLTRPASTDLASAEAWEAHDQILDRPVRVTFVDGPQAPAALDAARRAALVADARLCRVLDVGATDLGAGERSYVITEPFSGETLTQIVSRGLVDAQQARALMGEAATALEAARQRGVHHCALRPDAVRVDGHRVVVTGLGIDAGLAGIDPTDAEAAASDARGLVALGYYALTARWAADSLDVPWIAPDAVRPLSARTGAEGGVVPVSELVPHVDPEIDALVRRTFGGSHPAPEDPSEVVAALEPWGQVSVVAALPQFVQPPPERPVRSSVLGAGSPAGSGSRPGTPPPAPPVRRPSTGRIARAGVAGSVAGAAYGQQQATQAATPPPGPAGPYGQTAAYGQPPVPAQPPVPPPGQTGGAYAPAAGYGPPGQPPVVNQAAPPSEASPSTGGFASTAAPQKRGVNPTPIVLGVLLVGVVLAAIWAMTQAFTPINLDPPPQAQTSEQPAETTDDGEDGDGEEGEPEPTEAETPEVRPIIETGDQIDPAGDGEHPEAVEYAYDADPSTFWFTLTYHNNPAWGGFKEGAGYGVELRERAPVSQVELSTNSSGGAWQLRSTTFDDPTGGDLLAEGSFSEDTTIELEETVIVDSLVLWITELPGTDEADRYRLELNEITLS
nr:hypothetical protein [Isoptericola halotolerans]